MFSAGRGIEHTQKHYAIRHATLTILSVASIPHEIGPLHSQTVGYQATDASEAMQAHQKYKLNVTEHRFFPRLPRMNFRLHLFVAAAHAELRHMQGLELFDGLARGHTRGRASVAGRFVFSCHVALIARSVNGHVIGTGLGGDAYLLSVLQNNRVCTVRNKNEVVTSPVLQQPMFDKFWYKRVLLSGQSHLVDGAVVTAITGSTAGFVVAAAQNGLHTEHLLWKLSGALDDVMTVRQCGSRTHGPAGATIHRNVLVAQGC